MAHTIFNDRWNHDNGNETRILNYPLNENSWIVELGAYKGWFTEKAINKFNCNILCVEPVFCEHINQKFSNFEKVKIECCGVSDETKEIKLFVQNDATSQYSKVSGIERNVICHPIEYFFEKYKIEKVDLVQVNIEGEEYPLLEKWINSNILNKIKYLQIQYHDFVPNYRQRKEKIENGLKSRGFENQWDYDLVFTSWINKNI